MFDQAISLHIRTFLDDRHGKRSNAQYNGFGADYFGWR